MPKNHTIEVARPPEVNEMLEYVSGALARMIGSLALTSHPGTKPAFKAEYAQKFSGLVAQTANLHQSVRSVVGTLQKGYAKNAIPYVADGASKVFYLRESDKSQEVTGPFHYVRAMLPRGIILASLLYRAALKGAAGTETVAAAELRIPCNGHEAISLVVEDTKHEMKQNSTKYVSLTYRLVPDVPESLISVTLPGFGDPTQLIEDRYALSLWPESDLAESSNKHMMILPGGIRSDNPNKLQWIGNERTDNVIASLGMASAAFNQANDQLASWFVANRLS